MNSGTGKSVGQILQSAREQQGISLEEASRATSIKGVYLQELENDHPEKFASEVQARGFLRLYAKFLRVSFNDLIALWDQTAAGDAVTSVSTGAKSDSQRDEGDLITGETPLNRQGENEEQPTPDDSMPARRDFHPGTIIAEGFRYIQERLRSIPLPDILKKLRSEKTKADEVSSSETPAVEPSLSSQEVFDQIGSALRERRLQMQLNLTDIEQFTNIKRTYLEAIENGHFSDLPSTVQGRGMLNIYAQFLAMDENAVMDDYARALQIQREEVLVPRRAASQPPLTVRVNLPASVRRVLNPDLLVGSLLIVVLFAFIIWGVNLMLSGQSEPAAGAPSISDVLQITPSATPALAESEITPPSVDNGEPLAENGQAAPPEAIPLEPTPVATINAAPLQVYIIAHDRAYMQVQVDGREAFNGRVVPENVYTYSGQNQINLLTGNGAALEVYFNQEYLGELGNIGEVVRLEFSLDGLIAPTPTVEPTAMMDDTQS
jgi:cytoskeletal protein RodZ